MPARSRASRRGFCQSEGLTGLASLDRLDVFFFEQDDLVATPNADVGSPPSGTAPQPAVVPPRAMATEITDMLTRPQMRLVDAGGLRSLGQMVRCWGESGQG